MRITIIQISMVIVYLVITLSISFFFTRKNTGTKAYFLAKGNLGILLCVSLLATECISAGTLVGASSTGFTTGLASVWATWGQVVGIGLFVLLVAKFFRVMHKEKGVMSVAGCYEYLFDRRSRVVMLLVVVINYCILFSVAPPAVARIIAPIIDVSPTVICWVVGVLFIIMTITGGLSGIAWMNVVNLVLIFIPMFIMVGAVVREAGGIGAMQAVLPSTYFNVWQPTVMTALAAGLGTGIAQIASSVYANIAFSAKNYRTALWAFLFTGILLFIFALLPSLVGISGRLIMPDAEQGTILYTVANYVHPLLGGFAAMVTVAACFSSGPAFLLLACTTMTKDFYHVLSPKATEKQQLRFSKLCAVVLGLTFTFFGSQTISLLHQILGAFQIRAVVGLVLVVGILWKGLTKDGAFWGMLLGGIVAATWFFMGDPFDIACLWPGALVTLSTAFLVSLLGKKDYAGYSQYREMLSRFDALEQANLKQDK